jgi:hypothetical protein
MECLCYDRRLIQEEESVKWLGAASHQGFSVWGLEAQLSSSILLLGILLLLLESIL